MTVWEILTQTWKWELSVVLGCLSLFGGYAALMNFKPTKRWLWFIAGDLVLLVSLVSPLHTLGDTYLFSVHMAQHILLLLVVPPFLILGFPPKLVRRMLKVRAIRIAERVLAHPVVAWFAGIGVMYLWHIPALYDATIYNHNVHIIEHLTFLVTSTMFWWPVICPAPERRMGAFISLAYLFGAGLASILLGLIITFAPVLYKGYEHPFDYLGILPLIRQDWKLSSQADQQIGGLLMWVITGPFYLAAIFWVMAGWFREEGQVVYSEAVAAAEGKGVTLAHE
jgi:cytochrome c oxidase assembly factor CtaG